MTDFIKQAAETGAAIWKNKQHCTAYVLPTEIAWKAYDTYGLPLDIIVEICAEHDYFVDLHKFKECFEKQQQQSRERSHLPRPDVKYVYNYDYLKKLCDEVQPTCQECVELYEEYKRVRKAVSAAMDCSKYLKKLEKIEKELADLVLDK